MRPPLSPRALARGLFRELIEIDTTDATGSVTAAAEMMAARLATGGVAAEDVRVLGPHPKKHNLVARLRGTGRSGRRPLLLLAHLDVVAAPRAQWSVDPFTFLERDGHYYGRGTTDDKAMAALWVATLLRLRADEFVADRDIIVALTADEEGGSHNGARWLLAEHRELVDAEYGLNEGGYGRFRGGRRLANQIQASEKLPVFFELEATGRAGHSSLPPADSAILRLTEALRRVAALRFRLEITEVTSAFFARMADLETGQAAEDMRAVARGGPSPNPEAAGRLARVPYYEGLLRTTCVVTQLHAGQGENHNVLPPTARAVLDCRLLPTTSPDEVHRVLRETIADDRVLVRRLTDATPAPPSPLAPEVVGAVERLTSALWPGVPVIPVMSIGATDSAHFRRAGIPMYGVSGLFLDVDDTRAHAPDERVGVEAFHEAGEFLYGLVKWLAE